MIFDNYFYLRGPCKTCYYSPRRLPARLLATQVGHKRGQRLDRGFNQSVSLWGTATEFFGLYLICNRNEIVEYYQECGFQLFVVRQIPKTERRTGFYVDAKFRCLREQKDSKVIFMGAMIDIVLLRNQLKIFVSDSSCKRSQLRNINLFC